MWIRKSLQQQVVAPTANHKDVERRDEQKVKTDASVQSPTETAKLNTWRLDTRAKFCQTGALEKDETPSETKQSSDSAIGTPK
jgi:hypothetical protein